MIQKVQAQFVFVRLNDSESTSTITEEKAVELIPDSLFSFLKWICEDSTEETSGIKLDKNLSDSKSTNRKITSIAQHFIFAVSNGRQQTPKHIGLVVAIKHLTRSETLTEILNRLQHCIGYHDLLRINTSIANNIIQNATEDSIIIPSNIISGTFVQAAADNNGPTESTLDGKNTTYGTTIALYKKAVLPGVGEFGVVQRCTFQLNTKQRSRNLQIFHLFTIKFWTLVLIARNQQQFLMETSVKSGFINHLKLLMKLNLCMCVGSFSVYAREKFSTEFVTRPESSESDWMEWI